MTFSEAMELLKAGSKVTRNEWKNGLYFKMEKLIVKSYQPIIGHYQYTEDIMISDGWIADGETESKTFCEIIPELELGNKVRMKEWEQDYYIFMDGSNIALHYMAQFSYHPCFADFQANDWIEV